MHVLAPLQQVSEAGRAMRRGGVLQQPVEQALAGAGVAPVEPEAELLEIGRQVIDLDASLVGAQHPPLEALPGIDNSYGREERWWCRGEANAARLTDPDGW